MIEALIAATAVVITAVLALVGRQLDVNAAARSSELKAKNTEEHLENKRLLEVLIEGQDRVERKIDDHIVWHAHEAPTSLVVVAGGESR